jgi:hypothetical protein
VRCPSGRGTATIETVDGVAEEYIAAAAKILDADQLTAFESQVQSVYKQTVRISIEPAWARYFEFGSGRLPAFLRKLAEDASGPEDR